ncbi:MAG: hypothetical protein ACPG4Z_00205 [Chitinophagales bacterium]
MKRLLSITFIAVLFLAACTGSTETETETTEETVVEEVVEETVEATSGSSKYYNDIVPANGGDFAGISLGDSRDAVLAAFSSDDLEYEDEENVQYYWFHENFDYYLDFYFTDGKVSSIYGYADFYDAEANMDGDAAMDFYKDLVADFSGNYGEGEEYVDAGYYDTSWYMDAQEVDAYVYCDVEYGNVSWDVTSWVYYE